MACREIREERKKQKNGSGFVSCGEKGRVTSTYVPSVSEPGVDWAPTDWGVG